MDIEDQGHGPVGQDGGPGKSLRVLVDLTQVFNHGLMLSNDLIHDESEAMTVQVGDNDLLLTNTSIQSFFPLMYLFLKKEMPTTMLDVDTYANFALISNF